MSVPSAASVPARAATAAVMILAYNSGDGLVPCVTSVAATVPPWVPIVLLDNGSTDGAPARAAAAVPRLELVEFGENLGFAEAYNRGIAARDEDFIFLLNPDTLVESRGWLEDALRVAQQDPRAAIVATKLVFADDPRYINSVGGMVYWWTGTVDVGFGERDHGQYGEGFEPFSGSGGAMLVRRDAFREVGGFDAATFLYLEDMDLAWRLRLRGWRVAFAPRGVVRHAFSVSLGALSPSKVYFTHRNFLRSMIRNYSAATLVWALPCYGLWTLVKVAGGLFAERSLAIAAAPVRALAWNAAVLRDTLRARKEIQASRRRTDREIRASMGPEGFESLRSLQRRRAIAHGRLDAADAE